MHSGDNAIISYKSAFLILLSLLAMAGTVLFVEPIPQWPEYHDFADVRGYPGVPNALNVISNLGFLVVGVWGALLVMGRSGKTITAHIRVPYLLFFIGVLLTGLGSAWYHLEPNNQTLLWDRLPMVVAFMGLFTAVVGELIDPRVGGRMLLPLLILGIASLWWWVWTESVGAGDLRYYGLVQFLPFVLIPLMLLMYPAPKHFVFHIVAMGLLYGLAKAFELFDHQVYQALGGLVGGHPLKHLFAAGASACVLIMLYRR